MISLPTALQVPVDEHCALDFKRDVALNDEAAKAHALTAELKLARFSSDGWPRSVEGPLRDGQSADMAAPEVETPTPRSYLRRALHFDHR